jgi:hypothetical protein
MNKEITVIPEHQPAAWMDQEPKDLQAALDVRAENRKVLLGWIRDSLKEGTDYGRIHFAKNCDNKHACQNMAHFSKPSLWKAGAEKIAGMLGFRATWPDLHEELADVKKGSKFITLRCRLVTQSDELVSEGVGARSLDQDYGDANKSLKMAKKSSLIDAVLNAAGLSEVFTQDLSDEEQPHGAPVTLTEEGVDYLYGRAKELYGDKAKPVLESLARRRFRIADGNWKLIPDARLADAIRSLEEKKGDVQD